ncbi:MAG: 4-hydroxy-tetrahydrodipicolinate reductase [Thermaerobacter sp.]|nr:4-hydroxy-tetrahydrodipicolinate reductase [Thermaerobacter sp.]
MAILVVLAGVAGRTGRAVGQTLWNADDVELVGALGKQHAGQSLSTLWGLPDIPLTVEDHLSKIVVERAVLVDFTEAASAYGRILTAVRRGWDVVVGTTGFDQAQRDAIRYQVERQGVGAALVANFSLGAWVLEKLAAEAARYFDQVEIMEAHSATKRDRPSGTARQMAEVLGGALGRSPELIRVHSLRLPGMVAHQEVIFGSPGQIVTLRHDVHDRSAYASGVLTAVRKIHLFRGTVVTDLGQILEIGEG